MTAATFERFGRLSDEGPGWLAPMRRRASELAGRFGLPTPKNEDWHYTSPAAIGEAALGPMPPASGRLTTDDLLPYLVGHAEWPRLVFVNGRYAPSLSRVDDLGEGVRAMSLAAALREEPTLLERHIGRIATFDEPALVFTALNTALFSDGALVHFAAGSAPRNPVHLLFVTEPGAAGGAIHPRMLFIAGRDARASVIEQYVSLGDGVTWSNAVTEVLLERGATLSHYRLQRENDRAFHVGSAVARQDRDSHFVSFSFATGAALSRVNIFTTLAAPGSGATLNGLYMFDGRQHGDHQTRIEHAAPDCFSREVYKGILDGSSHGVFNGKVYVHPEAQKTDGKQTNNTLLLSERARVDAKPQLEIFADDVKCTHGATVGRIDETALFYMKSRGLPDPEARRLLTYAFAAEVLETIELEPLRDALERLTLERFTGREEGGGRMEERT